MTTAIPVDTATVIRKGLLILIFSFGTFILWATLAPLDQGVPLMGSVVVDSQRKPVQHVSGGLVAVVSVKDGQRVKAGQLLLSLDITVQSGQRDMLKSQRAALLAQIVGLQQVIPQRSLQVTSLAREITAIQPMVAEELFARNRFTEMQRQLAQLESQLATDSAALNQARAQLIEADERLAVMTTEIRRAELRAPVAGTVLAPKTPSAGAVVEAGELIMEIVPDSSRLIIEATIPPHLIEQVQAELPAQLRFVALDPRKTPVIDARVDHVSADLVTDAKGNTYYKARISVKSDQLSRLGSVTLHPGMPVEAIVVTGERSFLNYLLKPLGDHIARGLKER